MSWTPGSVLSMFSNDLAIDLGTANSLVYSKGRGIVVSEPSIVAVNQKTGKVEAVGREAKEMLGRTPGNISAIRPMKDGVIADFEHTERMLSYFIEKAHNRKFGVRPRIVIGVPSEITQVEKRAVRDSAMKARATEVYLVEQAMMAAIGAGLPITEPQASMIVDIGGGTTEVAIMSLADIAVSESIRTAGDDFDEAIVNHMKKTYNLMIGEQYAEKIKIEIGSAGNFGEEKQMEVRGRDMISGLPRKCIVTSEEIREALQEPVGQIIDAVTRTLERAEPELAADLVETGVVLAGGGALLRSIDKVLHQATGLPVRIADDPLTCVARGTSVFLENLELWKDTMESDMSDL